MTYMPPEDNTQGTPGGVPPQDATAPQVPPVPSYQQAPQYQQQAPQYAQPYGQQPYVPAQPPTNALAIVSLISAFFMSVLAIVLGHIALSQIKRTGERGRGLALAGTIIGYVGVGLTVLSAIIAIAFFGLLGSLGLAAAGSSLGSSGSHELYDESHDEPHDSAPEFDTDGAYQEPWIGTEHEAFCTVLLDLDWEISDEVSYLEELRDTAPDAAFKSLAETQLEYLSGAKEMNTDEYFDDLDAWYDAQYGAIDMCWTR